MPAAHRANSTRPRLAEDGHLDLAGVGQLLLDGGRCRGRAWRRPRREPVAVGDDADLAAGLDRVGLLDAGEAAGERLQLFEPADIAVG